MSGPSVVRASEAGVPERISGAHASWLNQIEIYFSIVQRKVLVPMIFNRSPTVCWRCRTITCSPPNHSPGTSTVGSWTNSRPASLTPASDACEPNA